VSVRLLWLVSAVSSAIVVPACGTQESREAQVESVLQLEDRRVVESAAWRPHLVASSTDVRRLAARGVGRVREPSLSGLLVERLESESDADVRRELVFALGQLADPGTRATLARLAGAEAPEERALAIESLGKLGSLDAEPLILGSLGDDDAATRAAGALALVRVRGRRVSPSPPLSPSKAAAILEAVEARLSDRDRAVREAAAYALSEIPLAGRGPALTRLLASASPTVRLYALRGLGRAAGDGTAKDRVPSIVPLLRDEDPHVAAGSAAALGALEAASATAALVAAARRSGDPRDRHVRAAALEALAAVHADGAVPAPPSVVAAIDAGLADPSPGVRRAALGARARVDPVGTLEHLRQWASRDDPHDRAAAASAAVRLPVERAGELLIELSRDPDARPAAAAVASLGGGNAPSEEALQAVRAALARDDLAVRATALSVLGRVGEERDRSSIAAAFSESPGDENAEIRIEALRALHRLAGDEAAALMDGALGDPSPAVAALAAELIFEMTGERPAPRPRETRGSTVALEVGRDVLSDAPNPLVVVETDRGEIVLELLREEAPRHVKSFLALARAGFYDGRTFHRVVPGFVIQGLDPRGDGWGTGGVFLRDEINRVPFTAGAVGMPNAGPDTAGCQIFVTHVPTPHLDGRYTVFGAVAEGQDVVDAIDVGDRVTRVAPR